VDASGLRIRSSWRSWLTPNPFFKRILEK
jgi:hypothetical protein